MTTWFTSDQHWGHFNVIKYCKRPFDSVEEMDEVMIDRWNDVVGVDDKVYHLGDVTLGRFDKFESYINQLNGHIKIVPGGHDRRWLEEQGNVKERCLNYSVMDSLVTLTFPKNLDGSAHCTVIVLCHYALRVWDRSHYGSLHLYGHSHGNLEPLPNSMDVGVDCHGYYPVSLEQVLETLR